MTLRESLPITSRRFTTSWLLPTLALGVIRLLFSIYIFIYLIYRIAYSAVNDGGVAARESFSYFTNITYWGLGFYFAFSGFHTVVYARTKHVPLENWGEALQFFHAVFYSSVVTFPFLVTIVYWGILASDDSPFRTTVSGYSNVSAHLLNSVFALFEIIIPQTNRPAPVHVVFLILFLGGYLGIAYITHATQGFYTYGFLDPATGNGKVAAYCIGILVAICVVFGLVWLLIWGRRHLTEEVLGMGEKFPEEGPEKDKRKKGEEDLEKGEREKGKEGKGLEKNKRKEGAPGGKVSCDSTSC